MDEQLTAEQFYSILAERGNRQPYYGHLGIHVERIDESGSYVQLQLDPKLSQFHGVAHGGVAASLIDSAIGMAVAASEIGGVNSMTLELKLNYLRPLPIGEMVTAHGWVTNKTRRTIFGEAEIRDKDDRLLAKGAATFIRVERELVIGELQAGCLIMTHLSYYIQCGGKPGFVHPRTTTIKIRTRCSTSFPLQS